MKETLVEYIPPRALSTLGALPNYSDGNSGQKSSDYWRIYFYLQYLLCFCPFRFSKVSRDNPNHRGTGHIYTTESWMPQRIVAAVISLTSFFGILGEMRLSIPWNTTNPGLYFTMAQTFAFSLGKFVIVRRYWVDKQKFVNLLNNIMSTELGTLDHMSFGKKIICSRYSFVAICIIYGMSEFGNYIVDLQGQATMWDQMLGDARYSFLFDASAKDPNITIAHSENPHDASSLKNILIQLLACLGFYQRIIMGAFDNMYVLAATLTSWTLVTSFISLLESEHENFPEGKAIMDEIKDEEEVSRMIFATNKNDHGDNVNNQNNNNDTNVTTKADTVNVISNARWKYPEAHWWPVFFERYQHLRAATKDVNDLFGVNIAMSMIETVVFFAVAFASLFSGKADFLRTICMCVVCAVICAQCALSADIVQKMENVRDWLSMPENRKRIPQDELKYILEDLDGCNISIKAANAYAITYSLLANMAATSITYFIICVQL